MPVVGDEAQTDGLKLQVLSVDGHRVRRVRVTLVEKPAEEEENGRSDRPENGYL
jgi:CBS domain containing-hemolysin-like protein